MTIQKLVEAIRANQIKFRRGTVETKAEKGLTIATPSALLYKGLAIHRPTDKDGKKNPGYQLTQITSGHALGAAFGTQEEAKVMAVRYSEIFDYETGSPEDVGKHDPTQALYRQTCKMGAYYEPELTDSDLFGE